MTSTSSHLFPESRQVFSIPELATLIANFSTTQDCARLLRTCRLLYKIATPLGIANSPVKIDLVASSRFEHPFPRFDVYAPHVRSLDVYGHEGDYFKISGWTVLISHARQRALLPNLHTLTIQTSCDLHGPDQPLWVGAFASPSLVNLLVIPGGSPNPPAVSYSAASFILDSLVTHRPRLQKLGLFPSLAIGDFGGEGESGLLAFLSREPFYEYLNDLTSLRHLSSTLAWFHRKRLPVLGRLPQLETMDIYSGPDDADDHGDFEIDDNLFPLLTGLYLHHLDPWDVERVISLRPLIKNLVSLSLETDLNRFNHEEDPTEWLIGELFPIIVDAPHLAELTIKVEPPREPATRAYEIGDSVLAVFSTLPLKNLFLDNIVLSRGALNVDLGVVWPSLTRLRIPAHPASFTWLPRFAAIPSLQYLELELKLQNEHIVGFSGPRQFVLTNLVTGSGATISSTFADIDVVARALLDMWPNLSRVTWPEPGNRASTYETLKYERSGFLNGHIASLRAMQALCQT
ncbi:hypothetical protein FS749_000121 [Ceratobasidium sp. UAMH 11750]|nr:hypothetical protein FS749_000121 [Ceratobasidium sp. UAMH 11750]